MTEQSNKTISTWKGEEGEHLRFIWNSRSTAHITYLQQESEGKKETVL